jgi:hypothetical protein
MQGFGPGVLWAIVSVAIGLMAFIVCQLVIDRHELGEDLVIVRRILSGRKPAPSPSSTAEA